ncbi:cupin domain-containing protein [Sphingomonas sp. LB-2]|uniref:cupin domain-containing protein n=1 Tax=Sphingomonas caeni TaxID=2984949 RepID=UPI0022320DDE|nr:cupin domain-containing protein [Sphingomonas caeni]MCW3848952.1 cupin domain-containing protein [Sphingomonas caeni]
MIRSVADLCHPHDPALIEAAMLELRRVHLSTDRAAAFARLLPWDVFNMLPSRAMLLESELRVIQRGRDAWFDLLVPRTRVDVERKLSARALHDLCEQGMSMVLNRVGRHVPRVAALNAMIERHFRASTDVNCYASFRRESAFPPHFDPHDVLVLQIHGSKRWFCHGQPHRFPLDRQRFPVGDDPGPVEAEILMRPGDLLYLPRGEVHWAETVGEASMHLTVRIQPPRPSDLLPWLAAIAEREEAGREDINALAGDEARAARTERLQAVLRALADGLDLNRFAAEIDRDTGPMRPINLGHMQELRPGTLVTPSLRRRVPLDGPRVAIGGKPVQLGPDERAVLAELLARDSATIAELEKALPQTATGDAVAGLARKSLVFLFADD